MTGVATIESALRLPSGAVIKNRIAKAAMTEGLADASNNATPELERLYRIWSEGGAGLLISGNMQVDRAHLERPGNIVVDGLQRADQLQGLAAAGTSSGNHLWMQLNHPGRQTLRAINATPAAPSAIPLDAIGDFGEPRELSESEILGLIDRFSAAAGTARKTGFTGVQIHAAHGYLLSQFLSPRANRRGDKWGGSLEARASLLLAIVKRVREAVGPDFALSVKLNSSDFQKDGFAPDDALTVASWLQRANVDLLEISGGSYERLSMAGSDAKASTQQREAYFLDFAKEVRRVSDIPLMVTGGFRTRTGMDEALASGACDMIGLGRPLCIEPDLPSRLLNGNARQARSAGASGQDEWLVTGEDIGPTDAGAFYMMQLIRLGQDGIPSLDMSPAQALIAYQSHERKSLARIQERNAQNGGL